MSLSLLGTSHISKESIHQIQREIDTFNPTIVCVELDRDRLSSLIQKKKPSRSPRLIFELGVGGYLFALVGGIVQQKLGNVVGTTPGEDMLTAVLYARQKGISVALVDQPISRTMQRVSTEMGFSVYWQFVKDFFYGLFFPKKMKSRLGLTQFSLEKAPTPEFVSGALRYLSQSYPGLHKAILVERNNYMAQRVSKLFELNPDARILVVVGAAHVPGMDDLLRNHYKPTDQKRII